MKFEDSELNERVKKLNSKLLNIAFILSFNSKLSKDSQVKLKSIEKDLNDEYDKF